MSQQFKYTRSLPLGFWAECRLHGRPPIPMSAMRQMIIKEAARGIAEHCLSEADLEVDTQGPDVVFSMSLTFVPRKAYDAEVAAAAAANGRIAELEGHLRMLQTQINNVKSYVNANL